LLTRRMNLAWPVVLSVALAGCHHDHKDDLDMSVGDMPIMLGLDAACATASAKAEVKQLNLVVIYDRSASMGASGYGDPTLKWNPLAAGMKAFFADPSDVGVSATLQFFPPTPQVQNEQDACNQDEYINPLVPLTPLPSNVFSAAIDESFPDATAQTPTLPAMQGSIYAAQQILMQDDKAIAAIVLVTDGEPDSCNSSVNVVAQAAAQVASTIPTFVIGIGAATAGDGGTDLAGLQQVSQAGGTSQPIYVEVGNASQTQADFTAALDAIRVKQVPCSFAIPTPSDGKMINYKEVNVLYTPSNSPPETLMYSSDCTSGSGWDYDDVTNPTVINLCPDTCHAAQTDRGSQIQILFGCDTVGIIQ